MKWSKLWSFRHWGSIFRRVPRLLTSPRIPLLDKLLLIVPALVYWVIPDVLVFIETKSLFNASDWLEVFL
ncbi:hypothetical protein D3C73_857620 [compost metagenome]